MNRCLPPLLAILAAAAAPAIPPPVGQPSLPRVPVRIQTALFGLSWGDPLPQGMAVVPGQTRSDAKFYSRPQDKLEIDGVPLEHIWYDFPAGRLEGIQLRFALTRKDALVRALNARWGPPVPQSNGALMWSTPAVRAILRPLPPPTDKSGTVNIFQGIELLTPLGAPGTAGDGYR